jgi:hypothetical protein
MTKGSSKQRFKDGATGADIVALKPGEKPPDPFAEARKRLVEARKRLVEARKLAKLKQA